MKMTVSKAVLAMALMTGCGGVGLRGVEEAPTDLVGTTSTSQALEVDLRMRGTGAQDYTNLLIVPGSIEIRADGVLLPVKLDRDLVDLTQMERAFRLATVQVPADASKVEFVVKLAPAGGFESGTASGWIDTRSTTLRFESPVENLAKKNKAVIELDASRSLFARDATTLALVPKYRVEY